jgi:hypothetical protein
VGKSTMVESGPANGGSCFQTAVLSSLKSLKGLLLLRISFFNSMLHSLARYFIGLLNDFVVSYLELVKESECFLHTCFSVV